MLKNLSKFLKSAETYPSLLTSIKPLTNTHGLFINNQIEIIKDEKGYGLKALENIQSNSNIIILSISKCLSSHFLAGSSQLENQRLNRVIDSFQSLKSDKDQQLRKVCKIVLQLFVNQNSTQFELHQYSKLLGNKSSESFRDITNADIEFIKSQRLLGLMLSSQNKLDTVALQFHNKFPFVTPENFLKMYVIARSRSIRLNNQIVLSPLLDLVNHSFQNNCQIIGKYVANDSFVFLRSTKQINNGEELTINYGNFSNNELYFKYNFIIPGNPYSHYLIKLNYQDTQQFAMIQFDFKKDLLQKLNGIPDMIKVFKTNIQEIARSALRVYFLDQQDIQNLKKTSYSIDTFQNRISVNNEKKVIQFLINNIYPAYHYCAIDPHPNKTINNLQSQQVIILKQIISILTKQLEQLQ